MARLFIAIWPPERVLDVLAGLPRPEVAGVRWTTPDQWHVTLRFLGSAEVDAAMRALERVRTPRVEAVMGPALERLGRAVLMVPVAGLESLATAVVGATSDVGMPPEPRPFLGHLTLARARGRHSVPARLAGARVESTFPVDEVALVESRPGPEGSRYTTLGAVPLA